MEKVNDQMIQSLCDEIVAYFNVNDVEYKTSTRPKPRKVSFIKKLAAQWTSDGVMVTEGYANDLEQVLSYLDQKEFDNDVATKIAGSCESASNMVSRYLNLMKFFDMDDIIARKFVNNVKNLEHDLEEIYARTALEPAKS
ncbi:MAG: hypothetical protein AAFO69_18730 [Bacteroidota bacterium]